jgi:hypothetical protein
MKDVYEILGLKEIELAKVKTEVEALGVVAPLLSDEADLGADSTRPSTRWTAPPRPIQVPKEVNTDPQRDRAPELEDENRGFLITAQDVLPAADSHGL